MLPTTPEATQLIVDLYGCDTAILDSIEKIKAIIHTACRALPTTIVEECYHKFEPIGISAIAVISTSHFSIHTWPEYGYASIDIFSCDSNVPEEISTLLKELLCATHIESKTLKRKLLLEETIKKKG